ncbi:MAG: menaquinone biosynthesis protein [Chloroflexi bacterium]|nr:menaquinone biosynthesis protein [Chloroflexota bacterium]
MLTIGLIDYLNTMPFHYDLAERLQDVDVHFERGVPSQMNKGIRTGEIDIAPISAIEAARYADEVVVLPGLSIASLGAVRTVLLFSWAADMRDLDGQSIALTDHSATSVELLKVLCRERYHIEPQFTVAKQHLPSMLAAHQGALVIGDDALIEGTLHRALIPPDVAEEVFSQQSSGVSPKNSELGTRNSEQQSPVASRQSPDLTTRNSELGTFHSVLSTQHSVLSTPYIFDLGDEWLKMTGLPFTFAVWAARRDKAHELEAAGVFDALYASTEMGLREDSRDKLADAYSARLGLPTGVCRRYLRDLRYHLTDDDLAGLRLFLELALDGFTWERLHFWQREALAI